ncbi:maltooligosyl trehalose synthase [Rhodopirellula maiorica SM1]|uniref:Maltooligosyl trehalose synthase n=1 Tax=Rhodopirellula maiorica SM1 TaxID=1265738 RepID=M5S288_9BACT|nr:malto-oligosyltrehalose synthase [Rhodopirellula maiorica]EMI21747.1 maltooligosyl trehalose synthase [Rhodopirellula maiorica SM1]
MSPTATQASSSAIDQSSTVNRLPRATYRFQLRSDFGFERLERLIPYLNELGISDLYLSPFFHAREDSQHGYDVVDHSRIEPAFGDLHALDRLAKVARDAGMGIVLDIVPNHMGINDPDNAHWNDVLENGPAARSAIFFDIDWNPPGTDSPDRVLLPFLGKPFGETLEAGELQVQRDTDGFSLTYFDRRFPLNPASWALILEDAGKELPSSMDSSAKDELYSIATQLRRLSAQTISIEERYREQSVARRRLTQLQSMEPIIVDVTDAAIDRINGMVGDPHSFDALEVLLSQQYYRLAFWQVAVDEINYRRFFDINDLAAIRVEEPAVFDAVHSLTFDLLKRGIVTGLRVDHPDGLLDPAEYFKDLQSAFKKSQTDSSSRELWVVAEKILSGEETLPEDWEISGTTGYEFLNQLSGVLVDPVGVPKLQSFYNKLTHAPDHPRDIAYQGKMTILHDAMASELYVLASHLFRLARADRRSCDFTHPVLTRALQEWIACFSVYRTYTRPVGWDVGSEDIGRIRDAIRWAKIRNPTMSRAALDFLARVLLLEFPVDLSDDLKSQWRALAVRLQQVTGPVTAKGIEDTAFYRYYPLVSLNEVGAELGATGSTTDEFHRHMQRRATDWPRSLSTTATHDAKRGEDVRARLHVLSEIPEHYQDVFQRWDAEVQTLVKRHDGKEVPDVNSRYLIHQTLLGTWPIEPAGESTSTTNWDDYTERMLAYFKKAFREAKQHTSWRLPSESFESAIDLFVTELLSNRDQDRFRLIDTLACRIAGPGYVNSLSQVIMKATLPGVPDFYQGNEFWDFHLVDPDNRQAVDFATRTKVLSEIQSYYNASPIELVRSLRSGFINKLKLFTTLRALRTRQQHWPTFASGEYSPLPTSGKFAEHVIAFSRRFKDRWAIVIMPRLPVQFLQTASPIVSLDPFLGSAWDDTKVILPSEACTQLRDSFTEQTFRVNSIDTSGGRLQLSEVFTEFPFSILTN